MGTCERYRTKDAAWKPAARLAAVLALALGCGACSLSFPISPLVADTDKTGSIKRPVSPLHSSLDAEDWRRARAALAVALDPQGSGRMVNWDNPDSGLKGSFTPVGQPFVRSDEICRAFLASVVLDEESNALQGTACRPSGEEWAVKDVKPWRKG